MKEKENEISLWGLFLTLLKINAITFGGGYTIAPVIRDEFSKKRKLITEEDMMDIIALAQSGPGAMAVSTSLLTGYRIKGVPGALVSAFAAVLPPLVILSVITYFYKMIADNEWVRAALRSMNGIIVAILFWTSVDMAESAWKTQKFFGAALIVMGFVFAYFTDIHIALIILMFAVIGVIHERRKDA